MTAWKRQPNRLEKAAEPLGKGGELGENQRTRGKPVDEGTPSSKSV